MLDVVVIIAFEAIIAILVFIFLSREKVDVSQGYSADYDGVSIQMKQQGNWLYCTASKKAQLYTYPDLLKKLGSPEKVFEFISELKRLTASTKFSFTDLNRPYVTSKALVNIFTTHLGTDVNLGLTMYFSYPTNKIDIPYEEIRDEIAQACKLAFDRAHTKVSEIASSLLDALTKPEKPAKQEKKEKQEEEQQEKEQEKEEKKE